MNAKALHRALHYTKIDRSPGVISTSISLLVPEMTDLSNTHTPTQELISIPGQTITHTQVALSVVQMHAGKLFVRGPTVYFYASAETSAATEPSDTESEIEPESRWVTRWRHCPARDVAKNKTLYTMMLSVEDAVRTSIQTDDPAVRNKLVLSVVKMLTWNSAGYNKLCKSVVEELGRVCANGGVPDFDMDPALVGFENGVLDIRTYALSAFSQEVPVSMTTGYSYMLPTADAKEECAALIHDWFDADSDEDIRYDHQVDWLQVLASGLDGHPYSALFVDARESSRPPMERLAPMLFGEYCVVPTDVPILATPDKSGLERIRFVCVREQITTNPMMLKKASALFLAPDHRVNSKKFSFSLQCTVVESRMGDGTVSTPRPTAPALPAHLRDAMLNLLLGVHSSFGNAETAAVQFTPTVMGPPTISSTKLTSGAASRKGGGRKQVEPGPDAEPIDVNAVNRYGLYYYYAGAPASHTATSTPLVPSAPASTPTVASVMTATAGSEVVEIGVDEVGRGPLFGRTYVAAVILPSPGNLTAAQSVMFDQVRDSKKITSRTKMRELADFIRGACPFTSVQFREAADIDRTNITYAIVEALEAAVTEVVHLTECVPEKVHVLADGHDFSAHAIGGTKVRVSNFDKGDNRFVAIACAAILAKDARDTYILDLCTQMPELATRYGMHTNMGYGTAAHMAGIREFGVTELHRQSFAPVRKSIDLRARAARSKGSNDDGNAQGCKSDECDDGVEYDGGCMFSQEDLEDV